MDQVEGFSIEFNDSAWWKGIEEQDSINALTLEELWSNEFLPPPPRPQFLLDEDAVPDGPTTCDLCTWAWHQRISQSGESEISWAVTLTIVSLVSAAIGAVVMITVLHCRSKLRSSSKLGHQSVSEPQISESSEDVEKTTNTSPSEDESKTWLGRRRPTAPAENHYVVEEGLYAELDRASTPAYRNTAYSDTEPSSAYYSDLSATICPERAYEAIGLTERGPTLTVPSNYV